MLEELSVSVSEFYDSILVFNDSLLGCNYSTIGFNGLGWDGIELIGSNFRQGKKKDYVTKNQPSTGEI